MKVISANVNGRVRAAAKRQQVAILAREPDVVALQEVTLRNYEAWCTAFTEGGYSVISTIDLLRIPYPPPPYPAPPFPSEIRMPIQRKNFNVLASRHPIARLAGLEFSDSAEAMFAFPEKHLVGRVVLDGTEVDVHNTHLPPGVSRGAVKVHAFEAITRRMERDSSRRRILCGDFNAPWAEDDEGPVVEANGGDEASRRWSRAELNLLNNRKWRDSYRDVHRSGAPFPTSHVTGRQSITPHRYDYIFRTEGLKTEVCAYLENWLERNQAGSRLSDHAPVEAVFSLIAL